MKQYCYTGDIKKLIPNGWKFQMLYASNYKSYHKNDIFMFVITKMALEISNLNFENQVMLIDFIINNFDKPRDFWITQGVLREVPAYVIQSNKLITWREAISNKAEWHRKFDKDENIEYLEDGFYIKYRLIEDIKQLVEIGGLEIRDI